MPAPCDECGVDATILYGHREDGDRSHLCGECHPERSGRPE